jgi:hypothetical protein
MFGGSRGCSSWREPLRILRERSLLRSGSDSGRGLGVGRRSGIVGIIELSLFMNEGRLGGFLPSASSCFGGFGGAMLNRSPEEVIFSYFLSAGVIL